jgi:hypothetical protein
MYVYWVTRQTATAAIPMLFLRKEDADRDAAEQNAMREIDEFKVVEVEVF